MYPLLLALLSLLLLPLSTLSQTSPSPAFPLFSSYAGKPYNVSYDARSIRLNEQAVTFLSGSIHYPRSTPGMWPTLMQQAALDGLNMIQIYVFWNYHEQVEGQLDWSGRGNLTLFLDAIAEAGLFANLRIGPYVCAEWDYGGIPAWLAYKPGMRFRAYNQQWMTAVQKWVGEVIAQTRTYFADHGGPIVLAQIENELGSSDQQYVQWNGDLADSFHVNVPWIMCNGASANNTINTCNGNDCTGFLEQNGQSGRILIDQPAMWTENEGWFEGWDDDTVDESQHSNRTGQDVAYTAVRWFARGGSHHNYYVHSHIHTSPHPVQRYFPCPSHLGFCPVPSPVQMYHGGNHYDRSAAGGLTNMYANGVNFHSDGLPNEPKKSHLQSMHFAIANVSGDLVNHPAQYRTPVVLPWRYNAGQPWSTGTDQNAFVYGSTVFIENACQCFLQTQYANVTYNLAAQSVLVLREGQLLFNSSAVKPVNVVRVNTPVWDAPLEWQVWSEGVYSAASADVLSAGLPVYQFVHPVEQLNLTMDLTEYAWYSTSFNLSAAQSNANLSVDSATAQSFIAYLDGHYVGTCYNEEKSWPFTSHWQCRVIVGNVTKGPHTLSLLSSSLGIENGMGTGEIGYENHYKGIRTAGKVLLGSADLTNGGWDIRPYLTGEYLGVASKAGHSSVSWSNDWKAAIGRPLTWFYAEFPEVQLPLGTLYAVLLDARGLNRGHAFINGHDIGRYWLLEGGQSGYPTQWLYHIPQDWLVSGNNTLTLLEEVGAVDPSQVQLLVSTMEPVVPTCTPVTGVTGGDFAVPSLVTRLPILNLNFTSPPFCYTGVQSNWLWAASDPTDTPVNQAAHQGVAILNGSPLSYIDVSATATPAQGAGVTLPSPFGGQGFDGSGWSIEVVAKFPISSQDTSGCLFLFQDAIGSWMTINTGNTFDAGDVDTPNRMQATVSNKASTGVLANGTGNSAEFFAPQINTWYHLVWTVQPYGGITTGQAIWQMYVNGVLLNYANSIVPTSTFAPIQGAAYPQASTRTTANIGKDTGNNYYEMTLDAFRVYDYLLRAPAVSSLANAYGLYNPTPAPTSYAFPASSEAAAATALVPTRPIFSATFSVDPTTDPAIPYTNYGWAPADPADSPLLQSLHPGVVLLNGSALSYIDLNQANGPQSCGLILPLFGLPGSGTPGVNQGLTFEVVFKYPTGYTLSGSEKIFDFGQGGLDTWDWAYSGTQVQFETQNNIGPGVNSYNRVAPTYPSPGTLTVGVWQHVTMVLSRPAFNNYTAQWTIYVNGTQVAFVAAGLFPLPITRFLSYLGGADYSNPNLPLTLDAFRIYDYALTSSLVAALYRSLYNPTTATPSAPSATGYLCFISYSLPGTVDYPWSVATSLSFTYNPTPVTNGGNSAYHVLNGTGTRTYTNRFGAVTSVTVTVSGSTGTNNLLYTTSSTPTAFDGSGLTLSLSSPVQLPGAGPLGLTSNVTLVGANVGGNYAVVEQGAGRVDMLGQSLQSNVPGFQNVSIGASNINSLAVTLGVCAAPLTFSNGLRAPTQPSASNGATHFSYSYTISDGATYTVQTTLSVNTNSAFATLTDQLGNPGQQITSVSGTRVYTHVPSGLSLTSTVTGLASPAAGASQQWHPYVLLSSSPGVYSVSTAPFLDGDGLSFTLSSPVPADGLPTTATPTTSTIRVYTQPSNTQTPYLTEQNAVTAPVLTLQQQTYSF